MDTIPQSFIELLTSANLATKKGMLNLLSERIKADESNLTKPDLESFIGYYPNFVSGTDVLIPALEADLNTLLLDKVSR